MKWKRYLLLIVVLIVVHTNMSRQLIPDNLPLTPYLPLAGALYGSG
jgi:hypothetical protein